jgi:hypothetical protein
VSGPETTWTTQKLLDEIGWRDDEESRRRLPSIMGRVARKLCFEHNKVMLHEKGEYWLARRAKRDRALAEQWMSRALRSIENKSNRWRVVADICMSEQIVPPDVIYRFKKNGSRQAKQNFA